MKVEYLDVTRLKNNSFDIDMENGYIISGYIDIDYEYEDNSFDHAFGTYSQIDLIVYLSSLNIVSCIDEDGNKKVLTDEEKKNLKDFIDENLDEYTDYGSVEKDIDEYKSPF